MSRHTLLPIALLLAAAGPATAQDWRTLVVARQVRDSTPLGVEITYGAGKFGLGAAAAPLLYQMRLKYPGSQSTPRATYDAGQHTLKLGIHSRMFQIPGDNSQGSQMRVELARGVPLDLAVHVGATDADMDLGGLSVRAFTLETGAADATLRFSAPNGVPMHEMSLKVAAAGFQATGLGNARADKVTLLAGIGDWDLRFDGAWTGDMTLDARVALGALHVHVPADVLVIVKAKAVIGDVSNADDGSATDSIDVSGLNDASDSTDSEDSDSDSVTHTTAKVIEPSPTIVRRSAAAATAKASASASSRSAHQAARRHAGHDAPAAAAAAAGPPTPTRFTLHIVGGATVGSIEVDHDLTGAR